MSLRRWLKIKQEGLRRFWSMFPLSRVPFWYWFFEPQPTVGIVLVGHQLRKRLSKRGWLLATGLELCTSTPTWCHAWRTWLQGLCQGEK